MNLFFSIFSVCSFPTDSIKNDTLKVYQSIMFQEEEYKKIAPIKFNHTQGFFCDFEDEINKNKKIKLNIGVGTQ